MSNKNLYVRSSAEEFLVFKLQEKDKGIQVRYENENTKRGYKKSSSLINIYPNIPFFFTGGCSFIVMASLFNKSLCSAVNLFGV